MKAIADRRKLEPSGAPSLQNALEMARAHMRYGVYAVFGLCPSHFVQLPPHSHV